MSEFCEMLENCSFFNKHQANAEVIKKGWIKLFCQDLEKSEKCARKKYRKETGQPPADNLTPTGKLL